MGDVRVLINYAHSDWLIVSVRFIHRNIVECDILFKNKKNVNYHIQKDFKMHINGLLIKRVE